MAAEQVVVVYHDTLHVWDMEAGRYVKSTTIRWMKDGSRKVSVGYHPGGTSGNMGHMFEKMLGPTKKLRVPTLRYGKTLLVGFSEAAYRQVLSDEPEA